MSLLKIPIQVIALVLLLSVGCAKRVPVTFPVAPTITAPYTPPAGAKQIAVVKCSIQDNATFKRVFGATIKGTALYACDVVSQTAAPISLHTGEVRQALERDFRVMPVELVAPTMQYAQQHSKLYIAAEVGMWASYTVDILVAGGTISTTSHAVKVALPVITSLLGKYQGAVSMGIPNPQQYSSQFLGTKDIPIAALGDTNFWVLGEYKANYVPHELELFQ